MVQPFTVLDGDGEYIVAPSKQGNGEFVDPLANMQIALVSHKFVGHVFVLELGPILIACVRRKLRLT